MADLVKVDGNDDGQRLDRWMKKHYPALPFGQLQKIMRKGEVRVDGKRAKGETRLAAGQEIRIPPQLVNFAAGQRPGPSPRDAEFLRGLLIYEDDHILALNKPAGLAVQGGSKIKKHIDGMLDALARDGRRPHLVHRLDKDTSGLLLLARDAAAARAMGELFRSRDIRKYYWGITVPGPELARGKIQSSLAKKTGPGGERVKPVGESEGRRALTYYTVLESLGRKKLALVAFWPRTGRMHQIRAHAAQMGCPLLGDYKYGEQAVLEENPDLPRVLHLHARRVIFTHPITGRKVDITAPLSADMRRTFGYFGFNADGEPDPFKEVE